MVSGGGDRINKESSSNSLRYARCTSRGKTLASVEQQFLEVLLSKDEPTPKARDVSQLVGYCREALTLKAVEQSEHRQFAHFSRQFVD